MKKKRTIIAGLVVFAMILSGCGGGAEPTPTPDWTEDYVPVVSVTGEVVPTVWAEVSARTGGRVLEVLVEPGDEVATGDPLVRLDPTDAQLAVQRAETALQAARARLALLEAGPRAEEIAVVEAQVETAEAALAQAAARRDQLAAGQLEAEIASAQAQVTAVLADQVAAHEIHEQTMKCYRLTLPDGVEKEICPLLGPMEERTRYHLQAVNEQLEAARAQLNALRAQKGGQLRAAEAAVQAAAEERDVVQAQLEVLKAGASREEIAAAQAQVQQAEAALAEARVGLERTEIRAPFAGTVGLVQAREGALVTPGQPLVTLGDLTTLRVETTDLDEIDVARVRVGQQADVVFDALPDRVFTGRVTRISPMAEPDGGGVNYTVIVEVEQLDPVIRWGMTAFVDISVE